MGLNVIEVEDTHGEDVHFGFMDEEGNYKPGAFLYFQIFGRPDTTQSDTAIQPFTKSAWQRFQTRTLKMKTPFRDIYNTVVKNEPALWTPRAMGGAEYEGGSLQAYIASRAAEGGYVAQETEVNVDFGILPSNRSQDFADFVAKEDGKEPKPLPCLRDDWKEACGIELPETKRTKVYAIAPGNKMKATLDLIETAAKQKRENSGSIVTHRGLNFVDAVALESLTNEQIKAADHDVTKNNVAWFEIHQGIFFTLDKEMYERAKVAFGAKELTPVKQSTPAPKAA